MKSQLTPANFHLVFLGFIITSMLHSLLYSLGCVISALIIFAKFPVTMLVTFNAGFCFISIALTLFVIIIVWKYLNKKSKLNISTWAAIILIIACIVLFVAEQIVGFAYQQVFVRSGYPLQEYSIYSYSQYALSIITRLSNLLIYSICFVVYFTKGNKTE